MASVCNTRPSIAPMEQQAIYGWFAESKASDGEHSKLEALVRFSMTQDPPALVAYFNDAGLGVACRRCPLHHYDQQLWKPRNQQMTYWRFRWWC